MNRLRMIIRLRHQGLGIKSISRFSRTSRNTVKKYLKTWDSLSLDYEDFCRKSDQELYSLFMEVPPKVSRLPRREALEEVLPDYLKRLNKRGVTREQLHKEYLELHPDGYGRTQFCAILSEYVYRMNPVMRIEHKAGDKMFIDYTGDKLYLKLPDGCRQAVEVFVAILGCSQLTYVEAVTSQKKEDLIKATENALHYFGGVPQAIVPDNLKSAVTKPSRYQAVLNDDFSSFAEHYGTTVYPARIYKPRDKALVENAVKLTYKDIYTKLERLKYADITSLNKAILAALEEHNTRPFASKSYSRQQYFEEVEKDALSPLNPIRYRLKKQVMATVMKDSHIRLGEDTHYYSVPYAYIGKRVKILYSREQVEIYEGYELIATHPRRRIPFQQTTEASHLHPRHQHILEQGPETFIERAALINPSVEHYIKKVLERVRYREQAYKFCSGILSLGKKVGNERLIAACRWADNIGKYNYIIVEEILSKGLDKLEMEIPGEEVPIVPQHENIRGKEYYK